MTQYQCAWPSGIAYIPASSPCGPINNTNPVVPCCANGDFCLSDNICAYTSHSNVGGSGYYSAGCSNGTILDGQGSSSACVNRCADTGLPDIVYDSSDGSWKCCGGNENQRNCQSPTNETFIGAAPSNLFTIWVAGSTATTTSTSTASKITSTLSQSTSTTSTSTSPSPALTSTTSAGTTPASQTTTPTPTAETQLASPGNSGLSVGAKTGIGIGAAVLALVLLAFISVYAHHRRRRQQRAVVHKDMPPTATAGYFGLSSSKTLHELPPTPKALELPADTKPLAELY